MTPPTHMTLIEKLEAISPAEDAPEFSERAYRQAVDDCIHVVRHLLSQPPTDEEVSRVKKAINAAYDKDAALCLSYPNNKFVALLDDGVSEIARAAITAYRGWCSWVRTG